MTDDVHNDWSTTVPSAFLFLVVQVSYYGPGRLTVVSRSHSDTPHSV